MFLSHQSLRCLRRFSSSSSSSSSFSSSFSSSSSICPQPFRGERRGRERERGRGGLQSVAALSRFELSGPSSLVRSAALILASVTTLTAASFDNDWRFLRADQPEARLPSFDDRSWEGVTLPHTARVEA